MPSFKRTWVSGCHPYEISYSPLQQIPNNYWAYCFVQLH